MVTQFYVCDLEFCEQSFDTLKDLEEHVIDEHIIIHKMFVCDDCGQEFESEKSAVTHQEKEEKRNEVFDGEVKVHRDGN